MRFLSAPHRGLALAALVVLVLTIACGPSSTPTPTATPTPGTTATPTPTSGATPTSVPTEQPKRGGILKERMYQDVTTYDVNYGSSGEFMYNAKLYNNLLWNPRGSEVQCDVCERWEYQDGGKVMYFKLREGIRFHDGKEMTSADVAYTLRKIMGKVDGIASTSVGIIRVYVDGTKGQDGVEVVGPYELKLHLKDPSVFVATALTVVGGGIVPEGVTREQLNARPYGSGPYMLKSHQPGSVVQLERNPNYFKEGLPYPDGADLFLLRDDTAAISAFLTKRIDHLRTFAPIPRTYDPQVKPKEESGEITRLWFTPPRKSDGLRFNLKASPVDNLKVRQAINLVIDRTAYSLSLHDGFSEPSLPVSPSELTGRTADDIWNKVPGFGTGAKKQEEIEEAKRLLAEAGYGNGFNLELVSHSFQGTVRLNEFFGNELAKLGIRASVKPLDGPIYGNTTQAHQFVATGHWTTLFTTDPNEFWFNQMLCGQPANVYQYCNEEIDRLFYQQSGELDPEKRGALLRQMEDILLADLPFASGMSPQVNIVWWDYVKGYDMGMHYMSTAHKRKETVWLDN